MLPSQIAFKAADYMAEHGNCKYALVDKAGRVCLEGAVRMAAFGQIVVVTDINFFEGNVGETLVSSEFHDQAGLSRPMSRPRLLQR